MSRRRGPGFGSILLVYFLILVLISLVLCTIVFFYSASYDAKHVREEPTYSAEVSNIPLISSPEATAEPTPEPSVEPTPEPAVQLTPEPTPEALKIPCDSEMSERLSEFSTEFLDKYYNYFGTKNADYYYWELYAFVSEDGDLKERMDLALTDRGWINTYANELRNIEFDGAWQLEDGSYEFQVSLEVIEYSTYWTADKWVTLKAWCEEGGTYGFLVTATE